MGLGGLFLPFYSVFIEIKFMTVHNYGMIESGALALPK